METEFVDLADGGNRPEWFYLDFVCEEVPCLVFSIAEPVLQRFLAVMPGSPHMAASTETLKEENGVGVEFGLDVSGPWGFGGVLKPQKSSADNDGFAEFTIRIPQVEKDGGLCTSCGGNDQDCYRCEGTGRAIVWDRHELNCIAATLSLIFGFLEYPETSLVPGVGKSRMPQLVVVQTLFARGMAPIGAVLSRAFGDYVRKLSGYEVLSVKATIRAAYLRMLPSHEQFGDHEFRAYVREGGQLIMDVPGNACCLYVSGDNRALKEESGPINLECHNVDGPHQQISLLAGLAALCGKARRESYIRM